MKTYSSKSSVVRAAAKALNVAKTIKAVAAVANLKEVKGGWQWAKIVKAAPKATPKKKSGTSVTSKVRTIANRIGMDRPAVMAECKQRGFNMTSASTMYANWRNEQLMQKSS